MKCLSQDFVILLGYIATNLSQILKIFSNYTINLDYILKIEQNITKKYIFIWYESSNDIQGYRSSFRDVNKTSLCAYFLYVDTASLTVFSPGLRNLGSFAGITCCLAVLMLLSYKWAIPVNAHLRWRQFTANCCVHT